MKKGDSVKEKHVGIWLLDTGYWILVAGCVLRVVGFWRWVYGRSHLILLKRLSDIHKSSIFNIQFTILRLRWIQAGTCARFIDFDSLRGYKHIQSGSLPGCPGLRHCIHQRFLAVE